LVTFFLSLSFQERELEGEVLGTKIVLLKGDERMKRFCIPTSFSTQNNRGIKTFTPNPSPKRRGEVRKIYF
jgi:hypothetical protein